MSRIRRLALHPIGLALLLIAACMIVDRLSGSTSFNMAGDFTSGNTALEFPATLNSYIKEFWFAETIAFILLPLVIWVRNRYVRPYVQLLPWLLCAAVMLIGVGLTVARDQSDLYTGRSPVYTSYAVHQGAIYYARYYDKIDPTLQSVLPYLLKAQVPVVVAIGSGYAINNLRARFRRSTSA